LNQSFNAAGGGVFFRLIVHCASEDSESKIMKFKGKTVCIGKQGFEGGILMSSLERIDVAVFGAAGQTGRPLIRALIRRGARVKAVVHRKDQAQQVEGAAVVEAVELENVPGLTAALRDVAVAYYIPPVFNAHEEKFGANIITAAIAAKLPRLVYHSVMHAPTQAMPHHQRKSRVELALRESPLTWTIMQPAMYAQTPLAFLNPERTQLTIGFDPHKLFTPVDLEDLAEAAATVLLDSGHEYATYELAGPERISFAAMAEAMSLALNRPVKVRSVPAGLVASVGAIRLGPRSALDLKAMLDHYHAHGFVGNANVLRMLLLREPMRFAAVMRRELT
jgi:NAD(P)H dehydrogenase (quinone)